MNILISDFYSQFDNTKNVIEIICVFPNQILPKKNQNKKVLLIYDISGREQFIIEALN